SFDLCFLFSFHTSLISSHTNQVPLSNRKSSSDRVVQTVSPSPKTEEYRPSLLVSKRRAVPPNMSCGPNLNAWTAFANSSISIGILSRFSRLLLFLYQNG